MFSSLRRVRFSRFANVGMSRIRGLNATPTKSQPKYTNVGIESLSYYLSIIGVKNTLNTMIVMSQHGFISVLDIIDAAADLGFDRKNIFLTTTPYSTSEKCEKIFIERLGENYVPPIKECPAGFYIEYQEKVCNVLVNKAYLRANELLTGGNPINNIIIVCKDGLLVKEINNRKEYVEKGYNIAGVLHTRTAVSQLQTLVEAGSFDFPNIDYAGCYLKLQYESNFIVDAILKKTENVIKRLTSRLELEQALINEDNRRPLIIGVIGVGKIGEPLSHHLSRYGTVLTHDIKSKSGRTLANLLANCDIIYCSSGGDITEAGDFLGLIDSVRTKPELYLVSCTSYDLSFRKLCREHTNTRVNFRSTTPDKLLQNVVIVTEKNIAVRLVNGGYPGNFSTAYDNSVANRNIAPTRAGIFGAIMQALIMINNNLTSSRSFSHFYAFSTQIQMILLLAFKYQLTYDSHNQSALANTVFRPVLEGEFNHNIVEKGSKGKTYQIDSLEFSTRNEPKVPIRVVSIKTESGSKDIYALPILHVITKAFKKNIPEAGKTLFVTVEHAHQATASMMKAMNDVGYLKEHCMFLCKYYSNNPAVEEVIEACCSVYMREDIPDNPAHIEKNAAEQVAIFWKKIKEKVKHLEEVDDLGQLADKKKNGTLKLKNLVIVDIGGDLIAAAPKELRDTYFTIGVEQTSEGLDTLLENKCSIPVVDYSGSVVEKKIDQYNLSTSSAAVLTRALGAKIRSISIVGRGGLAHVFARHFEHMADDVKVFFVDNYGSRAKKVRLVSELVNSDVILICNKYDFTAAPGVMEALHNRHINNPDKALPIIVNAYNNRRPANFLLESKLDNKALHQYRTNPNGDIVIDGYAIIHQAGQSYCYIQGHHSMSPELMQKTRALIMLGSIYCSFLAVQANDPLSSVCKTLEQMAQEERRYISYPVNAQSFLIKYLSYINKGICSSDLEKALSEMKAYSANDFARMSSGQRIPVDSFREIIQTHLKTDPSSQFYSFFKATTPADDNYGDRRLEKHLGGLMVKIPGK